MDCHQFALCDRKKITCPFAVVFIFHKSVAAASFIREAAEEMYNSFKKAFRQLLKGAFERNSKSIPFIIEHCDEKRAPEGGGNEVAASINNSCAHRVDKIPAPCFHVAGRGSGDLKWPADS